MASLTVRSLLKSYGAVEVLKGIELEESDVRIGLSFHSVVWVDDNALHLDVRFTVRYLEIFKMS